MKDVQRPSTAGGRYTVLSVPVAGNKLHLIKPSWNSYMALQSTCWPALTLA